MDGDRLIPGHPGPSGRLGNKKDVENLLHYMSDLAPVGKTAADEGKCCDYAMKEMKQACIVGNYTGCSPATSSAIDALIVCLDAGSRLLLCLPDHAVYAHVHAQGEPLRFPLRTAASGGRGAS